MRKSLPHILAHLVFADTQSQRRKTKRAKIFPARSTENPKIISTFDKIV
jgi:hypothetical protein